MRHIAFIAWITVLGFMIGSCRARTTILWETRPDHYRVCVSSDGLYAWQVKQPDGHWELDSLPIYSTRQSAEHWMQAVLKSRQHMEAERAARAKRTWQPLSP